MRSCRFDWHIVWQTTATRSSIRHNSRWRTERPMATSVRLPIWKTEPSLRKIATFRSVTYFRVLLDLCS